MFFLKKYNNSDLLRYDLKEKPVFVLAAALREKVQARERGSFQAQGSTMLKIFPTLPRPFILS